MTVKEGMYVRTNDGKIIKVNSYNPQENNPLWETLNGEVRMKGQILKASYNIIDLIEVGDYVNELPVEAYYTRYDEEKDDYIKIGIITLEDYWKGTFTSIEEIKTIVTKEQFSQMQYRIGDE